MGRAVDPAFARSVEKNYLAEMERRFPEGGAFFEADGPTLLELHEDILGRAIYLADRGSGGLRFKGLLERDALSERLLLTLARRSGLR